MMVMSYTSVVASAMDCVSPGGVRRDYTRDGEAGSLADEVLLVCHPASNANAIAREAIAPTPRAATMTRERTSGHGC
ncbi:MAG: hypothetical protein HW375_2053 [Anaerolineales bacterium]|nr:hypothetical protein [Anaerolineales bacterium]